MTGKLIAGALLALVLAVPAVPAWGAAAKARTGKAAAGKAQEETSSPGLPADASHVIALPMLKGASRPPMSLSADPWKRAAAVSGLYENTGVGARPAAQPTWVYLYYNPTMLWVAFRCEGQHGNELKKEIADRDGKVWRDDSVEVMVDPTGMGKNVYHIVVNSTGNVYDAYNKEGKWDAKLVTKAATDDKGWSVTIGIPFAALKAKMPEPGQAWAANFFRNVAFKTEEATPEAPFTKVRTSWAPVLTNYETPKNYGYLLFGPENMPAVRMRLVNPVVIGKNHLTVDPL
ncbi:MAG TPA: hypothetical protein VLM89_14210, partial [Phycisphaerae bacterium]|nr:hypothetical protein [Phycisphaerae bacterium]